MNKLFKIISIIANVAIITGLVKDTCNKLGVGSKANLPKDYDEV